MLLYEPKWNKEDFISTLTKMNQVIQHRGPDSNNIWFDESKGVGLGHCRLAIRDLSPSGAQPMISSCERYVIAYNGEIYSQTEITKELVEAGITLRGHSDTEVILEACAKWGVNKAINKLIGMFAFALFDREENELYLVRDRLGIKPLFWGEIDNKLIFGSELKAIRQLPGWQPAINRAAVSSFMRHNYIPSPISIYQDVYKLEPGTFLKVDTTGLYPLPVTGTLWILLQIISKPEINMMKHRPC